MFAKLAFALALVVAPAAALAQEGTPAPGQAAAEQAGDTLGTPPGGGAAVSGEHGAEAGGAHGHHDPSAHFNWFDIGYKKKDLYGGKYGDGVQGPNNEPEEPMSAPFVLMLVNFGLLLVLLAKFGGKPVRQMAESRSDQIKGALDEAAKLRRAAQEKLDEYSAKLASAQAEMDTMLETMRTTAESEKQRILAAAEAQAAAVKKDAEERIAAEIQRARIELAREVSLAATGIAEKLLREKTTAADQTKLVDSFVSQIGSARTTQGAV